MHISYALPFLPFLAITTFAATDATVTPDRFDILESHWTYVGDPPFHSPLVSSIYDPVTNTTTTCAITQLDATIDGKPISGAWNQCNDPTFYMKINFKSTASWDLEFKHRYRKNTGGKPCKSYMDKDCMTARAAVVFNQQTTPGFHLVGGRYTTTYAYDKVVKAFVGRRCFGGCGINSGAY